MASNAYATNGMNLEGYGAISTAMGGAAIAYDNGAAAMMNNPATLALSGRDGFSLTLAGGYLGPRVRAHHEDTTEKAFYMPAIGLTYTQNNLTLGLGAFSQGGMGAGYPNAGYYDALRSSSGASVRDPGLENRSELGVGRIILPIAWKANESLTLGGSLDYVFSSLDLKMLIDGGRFGDMMMGSQRFGSVRPDARMMGALGGIFAAGGDIHYGYFDFSDHNRFSGAATGAGLGGKIGASYRLNKNLSLGAVYHTATKFSDLTSDSAKMTLSTTFGTQTVDGKIKVTQFRWPDMYGIGFSYTPDDRWQIVGDYRRIGWAKAMKGFNMNFSSSTMGSMDMVLNQDWKDQNVFMLGAAYRATPSLTLRGGVNLANNPVPAALTQPLFPAIIKNHITGGLGYQMHRDSALHFSMTYAPKVKVHSEFSNTDIEHAQWNGQFVWAMQF